MEVPMHKQNRGFSRQGKGGGRHKGLPKHKKSAWFSEMIARRGPRIERGDMRYLILDTLNDKGHHGYDIIQIIQEKTGGMYRPSPGTVYPALQMLEDIELISFSREGKRKIYELTEKGRQDLESQRSLLEDIYEDMQLGQSPEQDDFFEEIHEQLTMMFRSIRRSFQRGLLGTDKADKVRGIIREAVQKVDTALKS
jgi:DNA-binding PadR family transcriptional regulator